MTARPVPEQARGPLPAWRALVAAKTLSGDPDQEACAQALQDLHDALRAFSGAGKAGGWLGRLGLARRAVPAVEAPKGIYIHGEVGRGKSMLMDLFFETAPVARKRRVHFHAFMAEIHDRAHRMRKRAGDPIPGLASAVAADATLLCFDEFQVDNIADAMILGRLFEALLARGVIVVATSNTAPADLYRNGLQRERFLPFIDMLRRRLCVFELAGGEDHRLARLRGRQVYHAPLDARAAAELDRAFRDLTDREQGAPDTISVRGREIAVPEAARGVARFQFDDLCRKPLGAGDYLALAARFHTFILAGVPALRPEDRNEARRFINLIDALYEARCNLVLSAAVSPDKLYPQGLGADSFRRTTSRLIEMQAEDYIARRHLAA